MRSGWGVSLLLGCVVLTAFWSLGSFFATRYEMGDNYPAYSTLRTDPLGSRALFESLEALPGIEVQRNFKQWHQLEIASAAETTLVVLGSSELFSQRIESPRALMLTDFLNRGGRLVVTLVPHAGVVSERKRRKKEKEQKTEEKSASSEAEEEQEERAVEERLDLAKLWGMEVKQGGGSVQGSRAVGRVGDAELSLPWYGSATLYPYHNQQHQHQQQNPDADEWEVLLRCNDEPVVMERSWGEGSLIVAGDSYFLSNESLWRSPPTDLISRLFGAGDTIIFDEFHFGLRDTKGVAQLAREYHLHGLFFALTLLAALFIWRSAHSFGVYEDEEGEAGEGGEGGVSGGAMDQRQGLVNILRHSVGIDTLLITAVEEWEQSVPRNRAMSERVKGKLDLLASKEIPRHHGGREVIETYNSIARLLMEQSRQHQREQRKK